jgi:LemA protein
VNAVKGAMKQEQAVFSAIADARTHYAGATNPNDKAKAASEVESSFARLLVVMENYPVLKSSENVLALQSQIEVTENRISVERGRFNDAIRSYNLLTSKFPSSIVASMFGFAPRAYFQAAAGTDAAPTVNL